jgi:uncharacterized protein
LINLIELLDNPDTAIALVGATDSPGKYGNIIYRDLKRKGYRVVPVNPNRETVDGDKAYAAVAKLPGRPDIVNFVVPPEITLSVLKQCLDLGLMNVWLQPGSEDPELLRYLQAHPFNYLAQTCIMVKTAFKK